MWVVGPSVRRYVYPSWCLDFDEIYDVKPN